MAHHDEPFDRAYWEDRYAAPGYAWSGNPNPVLVSESASLTPARALDIGSGEGGDAIWLAQLGWRVTGIDIAQSALDKARARSESISEEVAARIEWQQHDLADWEPAPQSFDLVSSQFMHLADPLRSVVFRSFARAVAPGGTLLIVGHDISEAADDGHRAHMRELMYSVDDVVAAIDGEGLRVDIAESRLRESPGANGTSHHDVVVRASRVR